MFKHILVPLDGSRFSLKALRYAIELAQSLKAEITVMQVIKPALPPVDIGYPGAVSTATMEAAMEVATKEDKTNSNQARRYLSRKVQALKCRGITGSYEVMVGEPTQSIIEFSHKESIDLIVMTTHGKSGIKRAILGSVADTVIRESGKPVLVINPKMRKKSS